MYIELKTPHKAKLITLISRSKNKYWNYDVQA